VVVLLAVPALVALATALSRRFGHAVGGVVAGLPLTSGPLSVSLALSHGSGFAARAASASLLGIAASTAACCAYGVVARRRRPLPAAAVALAVFAGIAAAGIVARPGLVAAGALAVAVSLATDTGLHRLAPAHAPRPTALGLLPRIAGALTVASAVTAVAHVSSAVVAGALTPLPVVVGTLAIHAHRDAGSGAAIDVVRGSARGAYGFAGFFVVAALLLGHVPLTVAYGAAVVTAVVVGGLGAAGSRA